MKKVALLLALIFIGLQVFSQTREITGTVTSAEDGGAIPGVSVLVKGTTLGTVTDLEGRFRLQVPNNAQTLVFSFVGMTSQEVAIGNQNTFRIQLKAETIGVDEVVVTALGIKREKREVTYQTQKVDQGELTKIAPTRVASALAGKVAGLQINVQDNGVNPSSQILLRGMRSITGDNSALIVIDGSIASQGAFDALNPSDIADISVLKGATAAALYGSSAGNGALIVTTKAGQASRKFIVGVNASFTMDKVAYMPDFQTEYGTGWEGAYDPVENTNWGPRFDGTLRQIGPTFPEGYGLETQVVPYAPVKDNLLHFFQTGQTFNNTVYLTGSSDNSSYYISVGDQRAEGIVLDDTYRRNTFRVNATKKLGKLELSATTSYFTDKTDVVGSTIGDQDRPLYWFILNTSANIPLEKYKDWQNPKSYGYADNYYNAYYQNPYWAIGTNRNIDETNRLNGNINLSYDILDWLNFTARASVNNVWGNGKNWRAAQTYNEELQPAHSAVSSFVEDSEFQTKTYTGDALVTGSFKFYDSFSLKAILGSTVYSTDYRGSTIRANNLSIPGFYDISNGTGKLEGTVDESLKRYYGFFGDFTLGYKNYLFLNFSGRNDWTSTLAKGSNSYFYPAAGLSFVVTDAINALKNNNILSYAKVTFSNSTVYNDLAPYRINEKYYQHVSFPFGTVNGFYLDPAAVDASITKEKINTTEVGLNLGFFQSRVWLDASFFNTITSDLITATTPSVSSGSTSFLTNIGELQGKGIELTLGGSILKTKDFKWDVNINYTSNETVVNEIYEGLDEVAITTTGQYGVYAVVGKAFPQMKANVYKRDPQGRIIVDPASGHPLTETGLANLGKTIPDYIVGLSSSATYKGFTVSATFDYRTGHVYYEQGSDQMEFTGRSKESVSANRQDFVIPNSVIETSPGVYVENTNIPVSGGRQSYWTDVYNDVKSNYVKDATALKLRELAVNYELPRNLISKTPFQKISFGFIGRNLLTWLPAENRFSDPEFNNTRSTDPANAVGVGGYLQSPPTKSFGFNLNVEF
ncbi:MAG TPA: SusC/RagA family TonB-linked outer membrane protein [Petrimonas sp.]|nr:SusC/RagA family TonB-linked outer membrane protein [Petrimonas sp.]